MFFSLFIQDVVDDDGVYMQKYLVEQLVAYCDASAALNWAQYYEIPEYKWPHQVGTALLAREAAEE